MSLIFIEGFDDGLTAVKWAQVGGVVGTAGGRNGSGLRCPTNNQYFNRFVVASTDEHAIMTIGMAVRFGGTQGAEFLRFQSDAGATSHLDISQDGNNALEVRRGPGGTLLGVTANNTITPGVWRYLEVKATLSDTVGTVDVRLDEVNILSLSGIDTKNGGTKTVFDSFFIYTDFPAFAIDFDDLYVCNGAGSINTGFLGDCAVETLYPSGNGNSSMLAGSDGNSVDNYALVNETGAPNTATYVGSGNPGDKDTYAFGDLTHTTGAVLGVAVRAYAAKSDTGARSISNVVRSGGSDTVLTAQALSTGYNHHSDIVEQNPVGPTAWTVTSVNAAEFGVQVA